MRSAIKHFFELKQAISKMSRFQDTCYKSAAIYEMQQTNLKSIEASTEGMHDFIASFAHPELFIERSASNGADRVAQKVFNVPELLELILIETDTNTVRTMCEVSQTIRANINGSRQLQRLAFTLADQSGPLRFPSILSGRSEFKMHAQREYSGLDSCYFLVNIRALFPRQYKVKGTKMPYVGDAILATLICQPPLTQMDYTFHCCQGLQWHGRLRVPSGITVGSLYAKAKQIEDEHRLCPHGPATVMDRDGFVEIEVAFGGHIELDETDPLRLGNDDRVPGFSDGIRHKQCIGWTHIPRYLEAYAKVKSAGKFELQVSACRKGTDLASLPTR